MTKYKENRLFLSSHSFIFLPLSYSVFQSSCSFFLYFNLYISPSSLSFFFAPSLLSINLPFLNVFPFVFSLLPYTNSFTVSGPFPLSKYVSSLLLWSFCASLGAWLPIHWSKGCLSVCPFTYSADRSAQHCRQHQIAKDLLFSQFKKLNLYISNPELQTPRAVTFTEGRKDERILCVLKADQLTGRRKLVLFLRVCLKMW